MDGTAANSQVFLKTEARPVECHGCQTRHSMISKTSDFKQTLKFFFCRCCFPPKRLVLSIDFLPATKRVGMLLGLHQCFRCFCLLCLQCPLGVGVALSVAGTVVACFLLFLRVSFVSLPQSPCVARLSVFSVLPFSLFRTRGCIILESLNSGPTLHPLLTFCQSM